MKIKTLLLGGVACAALAFSLPARAADLPVKAPALSVAAVNPNLIWYAGLGMEAGTEQANVSGNNLFINSLASGNLRASGGAITAAVGAISANPARWYRIQATAAYQNIQGANAAIGTVDSRWSATQEFDIGFEWLQRITAIFPNLGVTIPGFTPSLPSNVAVIAGAPKQYVGVLAKESQLSGQFFGASGSTWDWAPGIGTGYIWQTADASGKPNGGMLDAYVNVTWPQRGFTVAGVGSPGGPSFGGAANLGTQYTVGLRYNFILSN